MTDEEAINSELNGKLHAALVEAAARWLFRQRCSVVITEMAHGYTEHADAIGWSGTQSILVECKASRSDFKADAKKSFRQHFDGMGELRYYLTPKGMIRPSELPPRWGLLEISGRRVNRIVKARVCRSVNNRSEMSVLLSTIRRMGNVPGGLRTGIGARFYLLDNTQRATVGTTPPKWTKSK